MPPAPILFTHSSDELYGSDVVLLDLVRRLDPARFRPLVITPADIEYEGRLSQVLQAEGIAHQRADMPVLRRRYFSPSGLPGFLRRLRAGPRDLQRLAEREKIGLVHSNTSAVWGGALTARRAGIPHVWHVHEIVTSPTFVRKLIAFMVARYSDHVVAISQAVAEHLLADQPKLAERISIIHDAVDSDRFHPGIDGSALRSEWDVAADDVLVGVVGRISAWKGQGFFLDAFAQALKQAPNLRAVIVGDVVPGEDWRREELIDQARDLGIEGRVIWAGYRDDAPQVMAALDVLALPSILPEPFGMVVVEAMSAAKPVVATAHGGPLETVIGGETGILVSPHDPAPLAAALITLALQPQLRRRLGENARRHVLANFTFAQHVGAFAEIYTHLLV